MLLLDEKKLKKGERKITRVKLRYIYYIIKIYTVAIKIRLSANKQSILIKYISHISFVK